MYIMWKENAYDPIILNDVTEDNSQYYKLRELILLLHIIKKWIIYFVINVIIIIIKKYTK